MGRRRSIQSGLLNGNRDINEVQEKMKRKQIDCLSNLIKS